MLLVMTGCSVFSQNAIIVLHDSVKIRSELSFIRDNQLITKAGTIGLAEINYTGA